MFKEVPGVPQEDGGFFFKGVLFWSGEVLGFRMYIVGFLCHSDRNVGVKMDEMVETVTSSEILASSFTVRI